MWPAEVVGEVTAEAERETGIPAGTPVAAGTIDAWSEAASVGGRRPGDLMFMYGSTMFLILVGDKPLADKRLWSTAGSFPDTPDIAAGMATSGSVTDWLRRICGKDGFDELAREAAQTPAGGDGWCCCRTSPGSARPSSTRTPAG